MTMLKKAFITLVDSFKGFTVNEFADAIKERERVINELSKMPQVTTNQ